MYYLTVRERMSVTSVYFSNSKCALEGQNYQNWLLSPIFSWGQTTTLSRTRESKLTELHKSASDWQNQICLKFWKKKSGPDTQTPSFTSPASPMKQLSVVLLQIQSIVDDFNHHAYTIIITWVVFLELHQVNNKNTKINPIQNQIYHWLKGFKIASFGFDSIMYRQRTVQLITSALRLPLLCRYSISDRLPAGYRIAWVVFIIR